MITEEGDLAAADGISIGIHTIVVSEGSEKVERDKENGN